jgi:geranylgeranyl diphosphate synthase type I
VTTSVVPPVPADPPVPGGAGAAPPALSRASALVARPLADAIARLDPSLHEPVRHHVFGGGKHVRAGLVLLSSAAVGGRDEDGVPGAVAVELVHNYSLLHDDIIDRDETRRHRPTVWARYGEGVAIVAGDALAALAMQVLLDEPTPPRVRAARQLANANQAMIAGQSSDMAFEDRSRVTVAECLAMERGKTGALLSVACAVGALLGGGAPEAVDALAAYGEHLGISFQAVDDLLGIWGETSATGKPVGSDLLARKKTLPVAVAMEADPDAAAELEALLAEELVPVERAADLVERTGARETVTTIADAHLHEALAALEDVRLVPEAKEELIAVARFVTARDR